MKVRTGLISNTLQPSFERMPKSINYQGHNFHQDEHWIVHITGMSRD